MPFARRPLGALTIIVILLGCQRELIPTPNLYLDSELAPFANVPPELATNTVDLLYVTDRLPREGGDKDSLSYGYGRSFSTAFGSLVVRIGDDVSWSDLVRASTSRKRKVSLRLSVDSITELGRFPPTPGPLVVTDGVLVETPEYLAARESMVQALHDELRRRLAMTPRQEAFVFVHGFGNTMQDAAFRLAELWHFLGREGVPILYSWPAGFPGLLRGYNRDRESGEFTIFHLKEFLKALAECSEIDTIHLIAHSRGTDVAMTALRELIVQTRAGGVDPRAVLKLGNIIMAAPDIDADVSSQRNSAEQLFDGYELLTVYVSKNDRAIGSAEWLFSSSRRLGTIQPEEVLESERARIKLMPNADIIDARVHTDYTGHGYFLSNPAVLSDIILVLRYDRRPGAANGRPLTPIVHNYYMLDDNYPQKAAPMPKGRSAAPPPG